MSDTVIYREYKIAEVTLTEDPITDQPIPHQQAIRLTAAGMNRKLNATFLVDTDVTWLVESNVILDHIKAEILHKLDDLKNRVNGGPNV